MKIEIVLFEDNITTYVELKLAKLSSGVTSSKPFQVKRFKINFYQLLEVSILQPLTNSCKMLNFHSSK